LRKFDLSDAITDQIGHGYFGRISAADPACFAPARPDFIVLRPAGQSDASALAARYLRMYALKLRDCPEISTIRKASRGG
jgi:hypothetical protein